MKYIKSFFIAVMALSLVACSAPKEAVVEPIRILAPMGATSLSLLGLYDNKDVTIDTVSGSDVLSAELMKKDSAYDVIIAPINLGANLIVNDKSAFLMDYVVTWGNLYIVGSDVDALTKEGKFAAFGEMAVPQKVLMRSMDMKSVVPELTYYNAVSDVQAQLLTKKADVGLLAEPIASATIAKAKEKGMDLKIIKDLQAEYKAYNNLETTGYPQGAAFVKKGSEAKVSPHMKTAITFANETAIATPDKIKEAVIAATPEKLGVPSAEISQKTWKNQNIRFVKASQAKQDIEIFLKEFDIRTSDAMFSK